MALTGLQIFKLMPKTNCKECGQPTCMAFSMALATAKTTLDACPHVSEEAKEALGAASAPPVSKIVFGKGEKARETGDEVVLFRHDKRFYHPACLAITIGDDLSDGDFDKKIDAINDMTFERVGVTVSIDAVALVDKSGDAEKFAERAGRLAEKSKFALILVSERVEALEKALAVSAQVKPLVYGVNESNWEAVAKLAKANDCPVVVTGSGIDAISAISQKVGEITKEIILSTSAPGQAQKLADLTQIRRQAIRKKVRPLGYPSLVSVCGRPALSQVAEAATYIAKFGSIIMLDACEKAQILPLLALNQNLFSDPQKPAQVEPGVFAIGVADENSPVYCTTNFSLTYYSVEGEISGSKIPSWLMAVPTDGTSVLTAWAAGKFTGEKIAEFINENKYSEKFPNKTLVIPGHVAVLKAPIEEKTGWRVLVGPNEAVGIPAFAKSNFGNA